MYILDMKILSLTEIKCIDIISMYIYMCMCMHTSIHMNTYIYIYLYMYTRNYEYICLPIGRHKGFPEYCGDVCRYLSGP
jgi:hypothetical protein